jgi:hypothetical protein
MKSYKVTIHEFEHSPEDKYPKETKLFEQTVEDLNVRGVIAIVNDLVDGGISQD